MVSPLKDVRLLVTKFSPLESGDQTVQEFENTFMQLKQTCSAVFKMIKELKDTFFLACLVTGDRLDGALRTWSSGRRPCSWQEG